MLHVSRLCLHNKNEGQIYTTLPGCCRGHQLLADSHAPSMLRAGHCRGKMALLSPLRGMAPECPAVRWVQSALHQL